MATAYKVQAGDTLGALAKKHNTTVAELTRANNITNPNLIKVGQTLNIGTTASKSSPAVTSYDVKDYRNRLTTLTTPMTTTKVANTTPSMNIPTPTPKVTPTISAPKTTPAPTPTPTTPKPTPKPTPTVPVTTPTPTPTPTPSAGKYSVVAGDSLSKIAQRNGTTLQGLLALNPDITNPNVIRVGQQINLGGTPAPVATPQGGTPAGTPPAVDPNAQRVIDNEDLARKAGEAGLSVPEYQALMQTQNSVTQEESDAIAKELGIENLEGTAFKKPKKSTEELFNAGYEKAGLSNIKAQIQKINDDIERDRADLLEATGAIDENPFLIETSRVGRGKRVLDQAEAKINNKLAQVKSLTDLYDMGISELTGMVTRTKDDFGIDQGIDQAKLNYLIKKQELQVERTEKSRSSTSTSTYLKARADSKAPDLVGTSDTGYFKYDANTKKFVQVIAPAPKASPDTSETFKPTADQKALVGRFLNTEGGLALSGGVPYTSAEINEINSDPALFYAVLQKANESGIY